MTMTQQDVIKAFMASLANHGYASSNTVGKDMLDSAIRASSRYSSASDMAAAMAADQVAAEKQAVQEILGSGYAGETLSDVPSDILSAKAKDNDMVTLNDTTLLLDDTTVEEYIFQRKAEIFLETYCGIQLNNKWCFYTSSSGSRVIAQGDSTGNTDTGAITGSDADGSATEKTAASVVPETYANTYKATTSTAQTIVTNSRNWVIQATSADDTITANGADSISAGDGNDQITVNASGATVTSGEGSDTVTVSEDVTDITLGDLNSSDTLTIGGTFEVGSAQIVDGLLVVTDKTGKRKIRFDNCETALDAKINSTTVRNWLTSAGIDLDNLSSSNYSDGKVTSSSGLVVSDGEIDDEDGRIALDDYTPPVEETAAPKLMFRRLRDASLTVNGVNVDATSEHDITDDSGSVIGTVSSEFPNASTFTRNGLTIHLLGESSSSSTSNITAKTFDKLTDGEKTIVAALFKWWAGEALTLNKESYGIGFTSPTASVKDIGLYFYNGGENGTLAAVVRSSDKSDGSATTLYLNINMGYYANIQATDVNGEPSNNNAGYLDRTLAHEFTHAVMAANINYFSSLPQFIKEGTAELTHGIDDERGDVIFTLGYDADRLATALSTSNTDTGQADAYAGGYMFMRYLAKTAAKSNLPAFGEITATVNVSTDGIYYIDGTSTDTNQTAQVAASEADVPTDAIKLGELKNGVYTVNDMGVHQVISGVNQVAGLTVNDTFTGTDNADTVTTAQGSNIITGDGDDSINLHGQYATINAGAGADTVNVLDGSHHSIDAGDGDNIINFSPEYNFNNTVISGEGSDIVSINYVEKSTFDLGAGVDLISITDGQKNILNLGAGDDYASVGSSNSTILAGDGNDTVDVTYAENSFVDLGAGEDVIVVVGTGNTIVGGTGDDLIYQYDNTDTYGNVFVFDAENFGNDIITNFKADDKLILGTNFGYSVANGVDSNLGAFSHVTVTKGTATVGTIDVLTSNFDAATNIVTSHIEIEGLTYNAAGYYEISDAQDLVDLAAYVNAGNGCRDMTFKVTGNIDMKDVNFTPIGKSDKPFAGTFDGDGKTISNLSIDTDERCVALFSNLDASGTIQNVVLSNATVRGTYNGGGYGSLVGGLVSVNYGTVTNCKVDVQFSSEIFGSGCGALVCSNLGTGTVTGNTFHSNVGEAVKNKLSGTVDDNTRVYAVNAPEGFTISYINLTSGESVTIGDKTFYKQGAQVTATVTATDNHLVIDGSSFTATIDTADATLDVKFHVQLADGGEYYKNTYSNVSVLGSAGNDTIENTGNNVTIDGGEGNDEIYNNGFNGGASVLIDVSKGDDLINSVLVTEFDVRGFGVGDTINLWDEVGGLNVDGDKLVATVGDGAKFTIGGISAVSTNGKAWALDGNVAKYGDGKTAGAAISSDGKIVFTDATVTDAKVQLGGISNLDGLSVNTLNEVHIHASAVAAGGASIVSYSGNYAFYLDGDWNSKTFTGTDNADNIILNGTATNVSVNAGAGNDTIGNNGSNNTIDGGADDDTIYLAGTGNTVNTAQGNDTIKIDTTNEVTDFTVENFTAGDVIQFIDINLDPVTVTNLETVDGKLVATAGSKTVTISGINAVSTAGNNLWALNGNVAKYGDGYTAGAAISDGKIIFTNATVTDAKVQLDGISNLDGVSVLESTDYNIVNIYASVVGDNGASVVSNSGNYAFRLYDDWDGKTFTGTDNADNITVYYSNNSIDGGAGKDTIFLKGTGNTVNTAHGNDTIQIQIDTDNPVEDFTVENFGVGDVIQFIGYDYNSDDPYISQEVAVAITSLKMVDGKLVATAGGQSVTINGINAVSTDKKAWSLDNNVATYFTSLTSGAFIDDDKISFRKADNRVEQVQLDGISNLDGLSVYNKNVKINASAVGDNGASVVSNENNYAFYLRDDWDGKTFTGSDAADNIILNGTATNVSVNAGDGSDTIENNANGNNIIDGGAGNDVFIYNGGKLTITDFRSRAADAEKETAANIDTLKLGTNDEDSQYAITATSIGSSDILITLNSDKNNTITLKNAFGTGKDTTTIVQIAVTDNENKALSNNIYYKDGHITDANGTSVTLTAGYKAGKTGFVADSTVTKIVADNTTATTINAAKASAGVEVTSSAAANTIIGGSGNDKFTGAAGKNDLFIYTGGSDEVTNFEQGKDKVSLATATIDEKTNAVTFKAKELGDVGKIKITADDASTTAKDESEILFGFGNGASLKLAGATNDSAVTVNGKGYFLDENMFLDKATKTTGVTLTSGATGTLKTSDIGNQLKTVDASAVTGAYNIVANTLANVIYAGKNGGSIFAGGSADTIEGGAGNDVFIFTANKSTDKLLIKNFQADDKIKFVGGDNITVNEAKASVDSKGNVIFTAYNSENKAVGTVTVETVGAAKESDAVVGMQIISQVEEKNPTNYTYSTTGIKDSENHSITLASSASGKHIADYSTENESGNQHINAENAAKVTQLVASEEGSTLVGNSGKNTLTGAAGDDYLDGKAGDDYIDGKAGENTLTGGDGKDTFVFSGGSDTITDYTPRKDKILVSLGGAKLTGTEFFTVTSGETTTEDLKLTYSYGTEETGTLYITDGKGKSLTFVNSKGKTTLTAMYTDDGAFNEKNPPTAITLASNYNSATFDPSTTDNYKKLVTINSAAVTGEGGVNVKVNEGIASYLDNSGSTNAKVTLTGGSKADSLIAGNGGDYLIGGAGNDKITLGSGSDSVQVGGDNSTDSIVGFSNESGSADQLKKASENVTFADATYKGSNLTLKFNTADTDTKKTLTSSVVLQGVKLDSDKNAKFNIDGTDYTFNTKDNTIAKNGERKFTSASPKTVLAAAALETVVTVDASANTKGVTVTGGASTKVILGGTGVDSIGLSAAAVADEAGTLTGGKGNDVFVYSGGKVEITDYGTGNDKVMLASGLAMTGESGATTTVLSGVTFTANDKTDSTLDGTIKLTFGEAGELSFDVTNKSKAITIASAAKAKDKGTAYVFDNNIIGVGNSATVVGEVKEVTVTGDKFTTVTGGASVVLNGTDVTKALKLIVGGESGEAYGSSNKADTLVAQADATLEGGGGKDWYFIEGGKVRIQRFDANDKISIAAGYEYDGGKIVNSNNVALTYKNSTDATDTLKVTVAGANGSSINVYEGGKSTTRKLSDLGTFGPNDKSLVLAEDLKGFNAETVANGIYAKTLVTIDAHNVSTASAILGNTVANYLTNADSSIAGMTLNGGAGNDLLIAGDGGDFLIGGAGNDKFSLSTTEAGEEGADTIVVGDGGTDTVTGFNVSKDEIGYAGAEEGFKDVKFADAILKTSKGGATADLTLKFTGVDSDTGKSLASSVLLQTLDLATVDGSTVKTVTVKIDNVDWKFGTNNTITKDGELKLTSASPKTKLNADKLAEVGTVDASANTKGVTVTGSASTTVIIGSTGADSIGLDKAAVSTESGTLTGGKGNDAFVYSGGKVEITDYGTGSDKVMLASGLAMTGESGATTTVLSGVTFTEGQDDAKDTIKLSFGEAGELSFDVTDKSKAITIASAAKAKDKGTAYVFAGTGIYGIGKAATVLTANTTYDAESGIDGKVYSTVTAGVSATLDGSSATPALKLTLGNGGSAVGGKGADTLIAAKGGTLTGNAGNDTFMYEGGAVTITDYAKGDKLSLGLGWEISDVATLGSDFRVTVSNGNETGTLLLQNIKGNKPVTVITTTTDAKGKQKATTSTLYLADHAVYDKATVDANSKAVYTNATKVSLTSASSNGDFGSVKSGATTSVYKSMSAITANVANNNIVYGNEKANTLTATAGGSFAGGLGNDVFIVNGDATITDFGIGATSVSDGEDLSKLATKVSAQDYSYNDPFTYARGTDKLTVGGKITGATLKGITAATASKGSATTKYSSKNGEGVFSVELSVDPGTSNNASDDFTVVLEDIQRNWKNASTLSNSDYADLHKISITDWKTANGSKTQTRYLDAILKALGTDKVNVSKSDSDAALSDIIDISSGGGTGTNKNDAFSGDTSGDTQLTSSGGSSSTNKNNH